MITLHPLSSIAPALIEALLDRAFEPERKSRTAYKIRNGVEWLPALSLAARDAAGTLLGTLQCWPVALHTPEGASHPLTLVGPVAVDPDHQRRGIGHLMMNGLMQKAHIGAPDTDAMVMIGDAEYYNRFGFTSLETQGWKVPGPVDPTRLLARITHPHKMPQEGMLGPRLA